MRRFTRLTNAFSRKIENHAHAVAIYFMYYNFCRVHSTLRVTPAMDAGMAGHVWSLEELAGLLEPKAKVRLPDASTLPVVALPRADSRQTEYGLF